MASANDDEDYENTFIILVATDIHLGYAEKDAIRGDDSFNTFEEILQIAVQNEVDFILLGGDLFHDGRPTVNAIEKCMALLRHYCMGSRPISVRFLSDPDDVFSHCANHNVNYMDPNLNIAYPVFSIHGNHDDPLGYNAKCSLDVLSSAGLVNYFGRHLDYNNLELNPLLFAKGTTKLAIYGLGALKDKTLHRLLRNDKLKVLRPATDTNEWFNMLVLHQNRTAHKHDEYVPVNFLPSFLDLIIWGHEHENRLKPEDVPEKKFYVSQPGSSVATSLSEGEAKTKQIGILRVRGQQFKMQRVTLKTVRPFIFKSISLADSPIAETVSTRMDIAVQNFLEREVEDMIHEAEDRLTGHPKQPKLPLLRLKVEYDSSDQLFNLVRFGLPFNDVVANPNDIVLMKASYKNKLKKGQGDNVMDEDAFSAAANNLNLHTVEELVENYFKECDGAAQMEVLSVAGMNDAMTNFLSKNDSQAFIDLIQYQADKTEKYLLAKKISNEDAIDMEIEELRLKRLQQPQREKQEVRDLLQDEKLRKQIRAENPANTEFDLEDGDEDNTLPARGRGRGNARARAKRARGRGRGTQQAEMEEDGTMDETPPTRGRGSRGGRGARARRSRGSVNNTLDVTISNGSRRESVPRRATSGRNMAFLDDTDSD